MKQISRLGIQRMIDTSGSAGSGGSGGNDISLAGYATEAWVEENYLSKEFFLRLFGIHGTDENDDPVDVEPNDPDTTITDIEAKYGFWSDSFVSAFGLGDGGGGGGTLTLNEPLNRINTDLNNANPISSNRTLVWNGSKWTYKALTDGSVTSVGMSVPTGFSVTGSPITSSGTLAISFATGYSLPLTADVEKGVTAYDWGDHANAGYALASNVYSKADADGRFLTISFFRSLFKVYQSDNTTEVVPNNGDTSLISSIKAMFGLWTEQYLSAFGLGTSGGGTVSLCAPLNNINNNILQLPASNLDGVTFVWNKATSKFVYSSSSGAKLSVNGGITAGAASSINGKLSVTGNVEVNGGGFKIDGKTNSDVVLAGGSTIALSDIGGGGDENVKVNETVPSSGTWYYPVWYTATSGTGNLKANDGLEYYSAKGTTSSVGLSILRLGNNTASGTDFNSRGTVRIYGTGSYYGQFRDNPDDSNVTNLTANRTYYMPNKTGTLALTSDLSDYLSLSGGTMTTASDSYKTERGINFGAVAHIGAGSSVFGLFATGSIYIRPNSTLNTSGQTNGIVLSSSAFTYNGNKIWHAGNMGTDSGLDADLLDGLHASDFSRVHKYTLASGKAVRITFSDYYSAIVTGNYAYSNNHRIILMGVGYGAGATASRNRWICLDCSSIYTWSKSSTNGRSIDIKNGSGSYSCEITVLEMNGVSVTFTQLDDLSGTAITDKVAMLSSDITGNAATATKLQSQVSLWGNQFDGTADVDGSITLGKGAGNRQISINQNGSVSINASTYGWAFTFNTKTNDGSSNLGAYGFYGSGDTLTRMYIGTTYTNTWVSVLPSGNVGIGVDSPTSKLHVDGTFNATGNSTIGGTLGVTGAATLSSTLDVTGDTRLHGDMYLDNSEFIYCKNAITSDVATATDNVILSLNSSNYLYIGYGIRTMTNSRTNIYGGTGGVRIMTNGTTSRMYIDSTGNVSIGSTTASFITEKLNVNGNVRIGDAVLVWDSTNGALKVQKSDGTAANFYATGAVSAFGIGSSASGLSLCTPLNNINSNISANPTVNGATFVWNGNTSKFVYSSASGQRLYADTMYVDSGGLTVGNSGNLTVGGAATVTGTMTVQNGNLVVTAGRAGIAGSTSSSYTLYVHGNIRSNYLAIGATEDVNRLSCATIKTLSNKGLSVQTSGNAACYTNVAWSVSSDMRLKHIVSNAGASIEQIADAPIFNFRWLSGGNDTILGSSAQYWQTVFPCAVRGDMNSFLSMDYGGIALSAAVITARKVVDHEQRIRQLEIENEELKKELKQLKAA